MVHAAKAPKRKLTWRIYYSDGSTFDSLQGEPVSAPPFGIACIVQSEPSLGRVIVSTFDFYYWVDEQQQWWGSDWSGVLDRMLHRLPVYALLQGRSVDHETFRLIMRRADQDPNFVGFLKKG